MQKYDHKYQLSAGKFIFVPTKETLQEGLKIKKYLENKWIAPNFYYHFISGGHVRAIKKHLGQDWFIHVDIEKFFYQATQTKLTRSLFALLKDYKIAREIAKKSTVYSVLNEKKTWHLPYGFPQSSILASICLNHSKLGKYLNQLNSTGYKISIYVDDIIISGNNTQRNIQLETIKNIAKEASFKLNSNKTYFSNNEVEAFNIILNKLSTHITQKRMDVFNCIIKDPEENFLRKKAILAYIKSIEG